jgi:phage baseplate assembly protein W
MSRSILLDELESTILGDPYKYKDVSLDIRENKNLSGRGLYAKSIVTDIERSVDFEAISNSIVNIFNTTPGEKILSPYFGLSLKQYLFEPTTIETADTIGDVILLGLSKWEPRVLVDNIDIVVDHDQQMYEITLRLLVPSLNNNESFTMTGSLTKAGFTTTDE